VSLVLYCFCTFSVVFLSFTLSHGRTALPNALSYNEKLKSMQPLYLQSLYISQPAFFSCDSVIYYIDNYISEGSVSHINGV